MASFIIVSWFWDLKTPDIIVEVNTAKCARYPLMSLFYLMERNK